MQELPFLRMKRMYTLQVAYESLQILDALMRSTSHALEWIELNQLVSLIAMLLVVLLQGYIITNRY